VPKKIRTLAFFAPIAHAWLVSRATARGISVSDYLRQMVDAERLREAAQQQDRARAA
jgi:hypothetical protein